MKTKKTKKADLENKRPLFFTIGLMISLSIVLLAFEWKSPVEKVEVFNPLNIEAPVEEMMPITKEEEKKEVIPPKREIIDFELVTDETDIKEELDFFESEIGKNEPVDIQVFIPKTVEKEEDVPVWFVDEMPEFPGGMASLLNFINSSIKYPVVAQENGIHGKVIITFVIDKSGEVNNVKVFRGIDPSLDAEALRVVKNLPTWKPGKQNGRAVKVNYNVPINFVLQ